MEMLWFILACLVTSPLWIVPVLILGCLIVMAFFGVAIVVCDIILAVQKKMNKPKPRRA